MNNFTDSGYLIVRVSGANGAIPIEGASVIVQGKDPENENILISLLSGRDGLTERIALPAPPKDLSGAPNPSAPPFALYNIDVFKEGFYPQHYSNVPIFPTVTAIQNASIIPLSELDTANPYFMEEQVFDENPDPML